MKSILKICLIVGLLFSTNTQADEICNYDAVFAIPVSELQDCSTTDNGIEYNGTEGYHLQQNRSDRFYGDSKGSGFGSHIDFTIAIVATTTNTNTGAGNYLFKAERQRTGSDLRLRGTTGSGAIAQRNYSTEKRDHYNVKYHYRTTEEKRSFRMVDIGKMDSYRRIAFKNHSRSNKFFKV